MARVAERGEGRCEVQGAPFGKVYVWRPGYVVLECDCGERLTLTGSAAVCVCGADHTIAISGEPTVEPSGDEALHPWRYAGHREGAGLPF